MYLSKPHKHWINHDQSNISNIQFKTKKFNALDADITLINSTDIILNEQQKFKINYRIISNLNVIPDDVKISLFNTTDVFEILDIVSNVNDKAKECGSWLQNQISSLIKEEMSIKTRNSQISLLRDSYSDNAKKTLQNKILNVVYPECNINEETLQVYFEESFGRNIDEFELDEDGLFSLSSCFSDEDRTEFIEHITNLDTLEDIIKSRKYESAAGPDGIDYTIYKLVPSAAAKMTAAILKICLNAGRVPANWKTSVTRLIYKKGDSNDPGNWRPISVSNALYRITSCAWARAINVFNKRIHIYSSNQRGFVSGINGCADNAAIISELFYDARRHNKDIIITALDFRNAFGSVPHEMIDAMLHAKGFPEEFINIIKNTYTGSSTYIATNLHTTNSISINKGTKQGCPTSPLLFNLCLEPLFEAIARINKNDGYSINKDGIKSTFNILAYADDVLLISDNVNSMHRLLNTCERFCEYSKMKLAPHKSISLGYLFIDRRRCGLSNNFSVNNEPIPIADLEDTVRYLGAPIAARKVVKLKFASKLIANFKTKIKKITDSSLLIVQKLHAIKTFIMPTLDFAMLNGQLKCKDLDDLDHFVGNEINKLIGGSLPNSIKHSSWRDGGLSIPCLKEKAEIAKLKSLIWLITNKDADIRNLITKALEDERIMRNIDIEDDPNNQRFFDWKYSNDHERSGTNSIINRARKALSYLNLILIKSHPTETGEVSDGSESSSLTKPTFLLRDVEFDKDITFNSSRNIALFLTSRRRDRWKKAMIKQTFHLHSLFSFDDNPLSNYFAVKQQFPVSDTFIKFALASRSNLLPTPEFDEIINNKSHIYCPMCLRQGKQCIQSLAHILNGCVGKYKEYTERHNRISKIIVDRLKEMTEIKEIHTDKTLHIQDLPLELQHLRPDIIAWSENRHKCFLIEISVPYAKINHDGNTLENVYAHKKNKYASLVNVIRDKGITVDHITVVVSSIGAIWKDSCSDLKGLCNGNLKIWKTLIKSISANAIIGSLNIWHSRGKRHNNLNSNVPLNTELDLTLRPASPVDGEATISDYN